MEDLYILKKYRIYSLIGAYIVYVLFNQYIQTSKNQKKELITLERKVVFCDLIKKTSNKHLDLAFEDDDNKYIIYNQYLNYIENYDNICDYIYYNLVYIKIRKDSSSDKKEIYGLKTEKRTYLNVIDSLEYEQGNKVFAFYFGIFMIFVTLFILFSYEIACFFRRLKLKLLERFS